MERPLVRILTPVTDVGERQPTEQVLSGPIAEHGVEERPQPGDVRQREVVVRYDADDRRGAVLEPGGQRFLIGPVDQHDVRLEAGRQQLLQFVPRTDRRVELDVERKVHTVDQHAVVGPVGDELDTAHCFAFVEALERHVAEDAHRALTRRAAP